MKLKPLILFMITGAATVALLFGAAVIDTYNYEQDIRRQFSEHGLKVTGLEVTDTRIKVLLPSSGETLCPEDLQLIRYITSVIPYINANQGIYAAVTTPSGEVIYQKFFQDSGAGNEQKRSPSPLYMDRTLLRAELDYAFSEKNITCLALRETSGEQCYIKGEKEPATSGKNEAGRVLNFELRVDSASAELTASFLAALIDKLNTEGAGIVRYSLDIKNEAGECVLLSSRDLLTGAEIRLR